MHALALAHAPGPAFLPQQAFKLDFLATRGYHFPPVNVYIYVYVLNTCAYVSVYAKRALSRFTA